MEKAKTKDVDLIFRKPRSNGELYKELIWGKRSDIEKYKEAIGNLVSDVNHK